MLPPSDGQQLMWRGTFIDGWLADSEQPMVPRTRSAPLPQSEAGAFFELEQAYVRALPARAAVLSGAGAAGSPGATTASSCSDSGETNRGGLECDFEQTRSPSHQSVLPTVRSNESSDGESTNAGTPIGETASSVASFSTAPSLPLAQGPSGCAYEKHHCPNFPVPISLSEALAAPDPRLGLHTPQRPLMAALGMIAEVPERLEEEMQQLALGIVSKVQTQVSELCSCIKPTDDVPNEHAQHAMEHVAAIPEMVLTSLRCGATETKRLIQHRIGSLERSVCSQPESRGQSEHMARHAAALRAEFREAAFQGLGSALEESKASAARQMDHALASLPRSAMLAEGKTRLVASVPAAVPNAFAAKAEAAAAHVLAQATAAAAGEAPPARLAAENREVADALLRVKAGQPLAAGAAPAVPACAGAGLKRPEAGAPSVGSIGHPFLCVRPCVFAAQGNCASGSDCSYCHIPHGGKGRHLDKIARTAVKKLSFKHRAMIALPVLRRLALSQGFGPQAAGLLGQIEQEARSLPGPIVSELPASEMQRLARAMRNLSFRTVMTHVCTGDDTPEALTGDRLFQAIRQISASLPPPVLGF